MTSVLVLFRFVGYGLLLLTLFDFVSAIIPPQFGNPAWQFRIAGEFVERSAVPLIGAILVFSGDREARKKRELLIIRLLSWLALVAGIFYLALVVIFFITPPGLNQNAEAQVSAQFDPKITQLQQIQTQVTKAEPSQIETLMKNQRVTNTSPQAFKDKLLQEAAAAEKNFKTQSDLTKSSQRLSLIKNAIKWGLGALVTGVLFIRIWAATSWARQL
jgi:hypothetical protein